MRNGLMTMLLTSALLIPAAAVSAAGTTMSRSDVMEVQQVLADAGFYRAEVDGIWGPRTATALRSYQDANGISANGQMDMVTADEMGITIRGEDRYSSSRYGYADTYETRVSVNDMDNMSAEDMNVYLEPAAGTPTMRTTTTTGYYNVPMASPLDESETQALQQALRDAGYFMKEPVTGMWTPYTSTALRSYQIDEGVAGTGSPDIDTLQRLGLNVQASDKLVTRTTTAK